MCFGGRGGCRVRVAMACGHCEARGLGAAALAPWAGSSSNYYEQVTEAIAERYGVDLEAPWADLPEDQRDLFLEGTNGEPVQVSYRNRHGRRRPRPTRPQGRHQTLFGEKSRIDSAGQRGERFDRHMRRIGLVGEQAGGACR